MKRWITRVGAAACAGLLMCSFAACKGNSKEETSASVASTAQQTAASGGTTAPVNTTGEDGSTAPATTADGTTNGKGTTKNSSNASTAKKTKAEIVQIYNDAYNKTKATGKFLGRSTTSTGSVIFHGNENKTLTGVVSNIVNVAAKPETGVPLPPAGSGFNTSKLTAGDIKSAKLEDLGSSYRITLVPIDTTNPTNGSAGAGRLFDVMPDISPYFGQIPGFKWTKGNAKDNAKIVYSGGSATVTINKASGQFTAATYNAPCTIYINNGKVLTISIDEASIRVNIVTKYPG